MISEDDKFKLLDKLIEDREALERVREEAGGFNIFRVLKIHEAEIRHSNVLAWLLDPEADHGLGDAFIREFVLSFADGSVLSMSRAYMLDFDRTMVLREFHNIDILVDVPSEKLLLVIENKIRSVDGNGQLERYRRYVEGAYPDYMRILLYLTLNGSDPEEESDDWMSISYRESVLPVLSSLSTSEDLNPEKKLLIDHYAKLIGDYTMENEELVILCKSLYARHKTAIDLIYDYGNQVDFSELESRLADLAGPIVRKGKSLWFVPNDIANLQLDRFAIGGWPVQSPVAFWFLTDDSGDTSRLMLNIEVGPIMDQEKRRAVLDALARRGFDKASKARGNKYTRITRKQVAELASMDPEAIAELGLKMYRKAADAHLQTIVQALKEV